MNAPLRIALAIEQTNNHARGISKGISLYFQTHGSWVFSAIGQRQGCRVVASPLEDFDRFAHDGIIAYTHDREMLQRFIDSGLPVVSTTQTGIPALKLPAVFTDDWAVGKLAADYFIARGFKNFAYCNSFPNLPCAVQRGSGFAEQVKIRGFSLSSFALPNDPPMKIIWERDQKNIARRIKFLNRPLALFANNDSCGRFFADICRDAGIRVPEEIAILGTNNDELICEFSNPCLSSITLAKEQVGFEAAALLERLIKGGKSPSRPVLVPPLGITTRRSSDTFATEDPYVAKALNYIYNHSSTLISVTDIFEEVHLSRRYLEYRFRKETGRSLYEEIRRVHIEKAKKLLSETNLMMDQIAEAAGFSETRHFYTNFRKETGLSPTQYRKQFKIIKLADDHQIPSGALHGAGQDTAGTT